MNPNTPNNTDDQNDLIRNGPLPFGNDENKPKEESPMSMPFGDTMKTEDKPMDSAAAEAKVAEIVGGGSPKKKVNMKLVVGALAIVGFIVAGGIVAMQSTGTFLTETRDDRSRAGGISCGAGECNDGFTYGQDCSAPQTSCVQRNNEACASHGGHKSGGGPITCGGTTTAPTSGTDTRKTCNAGSHPACVGKKDGDSASYTKDGQTVQGKCGFNGYIDGKSVCGWVPTGGCVPNGQEKKTGFCCSGNSIGGVCVGENVTAAPTQTPSVPDSGSIPTCTRDAANRGIDIVGVANARLCSTGTQNTWECLSGYTKSGGQCLSGAVTCQDDGKLKGNYSTCCSGKQYSSGGLIYCGTAPTQLTTCTKTTNPSLAANYDNCRTSTGTQTRQCKEGYNISGTGTSATCVSALGTGTNNNCATGSFGTCSGKTIGAACTYTVNNGPQQNGSCINAGNNLCTCQSTQGTGGPITTTAPTGGGQCAGVLQSCDSTPCCGGQNLVCQGSTGNRKCQQTGTGGSGDSWCAAGGGASGGAACNMWYGFKCTKLTNGQCLENPGGPYSSEAQARSYAGNACGQVDQVCNSASGDRAGQLCGGFEVINNSCGAGGGTPIATKTPTSAPVMCTAVKLWYRDGTEWKTVSFADAKTKIKVGDAVRISSTGKGRAFTKARFRIKVGSAAYGTWQETTTKDNGEFYINYTIPSAGNFGVQAQLM